MEKGKFEEMFDRLPSNIKETEVLRLSSKKVLAALLELLLHSKARESRVIYCSNTTLRRLSGVGSQELLPSIHQLMDYDLITRVVGSARKGGETKGEASEYTINIRKLKEPLVEKTFDDLFDEFLEDEAAESLEMPINTTTTTSNTTTITNPISISNTTTITNPISISNTTSTTNPIETTSSTEITIPTPLQVQEQCQVKHERPKSFKDLHYYFIQRIEEECKDKNSDELNEIQESLKDELDKFNEIRGYKNIYRYLIIPSIENKRKKLQEKGFEDFVTEFNQEESTESQLDSSEPPSEKETVNDEQNYIPTAEDNQQLREINKIVNPYLVKVQSAKSKVVLDSIIASLTQEVKEYICSIGDVSDWVIEEFSGRVADYQSARLTEIEKEHSEVINMQLRQFDQLTSYY